MTSATPTLLLIPGLVSDRTVWAPLARAWQGTLPVVEADLTSGDSIQGWAKALLDGNPGPLLVVGHSMGGRVAMEMARIAPDRIAGLVLANTGHHPRAEGEAARRQALVDLAFRDLEAFIERWLPPMLAPRHGADRALRAPLEAMVRRAGPECHARQIRALLDRPAVTPHLAAIPCPVLLVAATEDGWSPVAQHQEIAAALPDAELAVIGEAGHFAPVERPEAVTRAIGEWIARRLDLNPSPDAATETAPAPTRKGDARHDA